MYYESWPDPVDEEATVTSQRVAMDAALAIAQADWEAHVDSEISALGSLPEVQRLEGAISVSREDRGAELYDQETMGVTFGPHYFKVKLAAIRKAEVTRLRTALGV